MKTMMDKDKLKKLLMFESKRRLVTNKLDWDLFDYCGGNINDAFDYGLDQGRVSFAVEILKDFFCDEIDSDEKEPEDDEVK